MVKDLKKWCGFNTTIKNKIGDHSRIKKSDYFYIKEELYLGQNLFKKYNIVRCIRKFRLLVFRQWGLFLDDLCEVSSGENFSTRNFFKQYNIYKQFLNAQYPTINNLTENRNYLFYNKNFNKFENKTKEVSEIEGEKYRSNVSNVKTNWIFSQGRIGTRSNDVKFQNGRKEYVNAFIARFYESQIIRYRINDRVSDRSQITLSGIDNRVINRSQITNNHIDNRLINSNQITSSKFVNKLIFKMADNKRVFTSLFNTLPTKTEVSYKFHLNKTPYVYYLEEDKPYLNVLAKGEGNRSNKRDLVIDERLNESYNTKNPSIIKRTSKRFDNNIKVYEESPGSEVKRARSDSRYIDVIKNKLNYKLNNNCNENNYKQSNSCKNNSTQSCNYKNNSNLEHSDSYKQSSNYKHNRILRSNYKQNNDFNESRNYSEDKNYNSIIKQKKQIVTALGKYQLPLLQSLKSSIISDVVSNSYVHKTNDFTVNTVETSRGKFFENVTHINKHDFIESIVNAEEINGRERKEGFYNTKKNSLYTPSDSLTLRKPVKKDVVQVEDKEEILQKQFVETSKPDYFNEKSIKKKVLEELESEEINIIADKVYKVLERKIAIQKDKRGVW